MFAELVSLTFLPESQDIDFKIFVFFQMDIPAIGFSPLTNTVPRLHDHNEYLNADVYLAGIEVYKKIIPSLGNV